MKFLSASFTVKFFLFLSFIFWSGQGIKAQLSPGDLMFVGFNADGNKGFALAALVAVPANTILYITDHDWNGTVLSGGEGTVTWNSGVSIIPAGNVIIFTNVTGIVASTFGSCVKSGNPNMAAGGESLYVFYGVTPLLPTTFITVYSSNNYGSGPNPNTLTNTGLTAGVNATSMSGGQDVCVYNVGNVLPPCSTTLGPCQAQLANPTNWSCEDGTGDQSNNGGIDFPSSVPLSPNVSVLSIQLISFTAELTEDNTVLLNWLTSLELNNAYFEIEKRTSNDNWEIISRITGAGNS